MDNSMDIDLRDSNSMKSLSFIWTAGFKDNSDLMQFNEDGTENRFKLVQERIKDLTYFHLYKKDLSQIFTVDLKNGSINFGKTIEIESKGDKNNIRLIFFRRHRVTIGITNLKEQHIITYHLGFQYNDKLGNNRQIVLIIDSEGNWVIGE